MKRTFKKIEGVIENFIENYKKQISQGNVELAFSTAEAYLKQDTQVFNKILHLKARFNLLTTQRKRNLISTENANVERDKITWSMIEIVDELKPIHIVSDDGINNDYEEDWGFFEYLEEYKDSQQDFMHCLQNMNSIQKSFSEALAKAKGLTDKMKNEKKSQTLTGLKSVTRDLAKSLNVFIDEFSLEITKFDVLINRNTYSSFKVIEFMLMSSKKIDLKAIKAIKSNIQKLQDSMRSLEKSMKKSKTSYGKRFSFGKELNAARRRAFKEHDMFISKCKRSAELFEKNYNNITILQLEYRVKNSLLNKLLANLGFRKRIMLSKQRIKKHYFN